MAAFDLTAAEPLMKIAFAPRVVKQFNSAAVFYNRRADGKGIPISNRGFEIPVHTGPGASETWYADGGTLPAGDGEIVNRASVGFFSYSRAIQFTGAALDAAGDDQVTYARALAFNVRNATVNAIKSLNIYSFGDGSGILAKVGVGVTLSTTVNTTVNMSGSGDGERYLRAGQVIDFLTGTTTPVQATATIVSISSVIGFPTNTAGTATIVVGPATAASALNIGDAVTLTGALGKVMAGLKLLVDDGSTATVLQNINRTLVPQYKAVNVVLTGAPPLARDYLRRMISNIQIARGSVNPSNLELWSYPSQLHAYADMGWPLKRFMGTNMKLDLGYTAYEFEGMPWIIDTDAPRDVIYAIDNDSIFKVTARELSFDDRTGSILRQIPSSTAGQFADKFVAFLLFRGNLGVYSPDANSQISGLAVPAGY
jgi:hypothetical protein